MPASSGGPLRILLDRHMDVYERIGRQWPDAAEPQAWPGFFLNSSQLAIEIGQLAGRNEHGCAQYRQVRLSLVRDQVTCQRRELIQKPLRIVIAPRSNRLGDLPAQIDPVIIILAVAGN